MPERGTRSKRLRGLVVDDEVDFATALVQRLSRRGFAADAVFSGTDAVARVTEIPPDVMLLDLKLPGLDGLDTLRAVRRIAPGVCVIVLTGHGTVASGIEGMQIGAEDYLLKPVDIDVLCTAIAATAAGARRDENAAPEGGSAS